MVREETDKKTNDLQARHLVCRDLERYVRCVEMQKKTKGSHRETQCSTIPEDSVVLTSLILMMRIQGYHENSRRKLEIPMPAAMPCKLQRDKYRETCRTVEEHKTKCACIFEADGSRRKRMEGSPHKNHEDHIAGKGMNSLSRYKLAHKFIPMPQALKIPDSKAAVEKEWEKLDKILAWQLTKVRNKMR